MWCDAVAWFVIFQAEDGIRDLVRSRGLGDVYKRQDLGRAVRLQRSADRLRRRRRAHRALRTRIGQRRHRVRLDHPGTADRLGGVARDQPGRPGRPPVVAVGGLSLIHISEPTRPS